MLGLSLLTWLLASEFSTGSPLSIRQSSASPAQLTRNPLNCPGYTASNVTNSGSSISGSLTLAGAPCNAFSSDITNLRFEAKYEKDYRLHVKIYDADSERYEVPEEVFPRPNDSTAENPRLRFEHVDSPFSFAVVRVETGEAIFNTSGYNLVYENQFLNLRTQLPQNPNVYGLGEHTDPFRLPSTDYTRTLWTRDAFGVPQGTNLYGSHPIYMENRPNGTHSVLLLNSNGMDIVLNSTENSNFLEYRAIGGILDFYFLEGPTPVEAARQYAELSGLAASVPYWSLGFHQCRYGYRNYVEVAQVIQNYSAAMIPLETQWTDIDYMYRRQVFTLDDQYFPIEGVREVVDYLHARDQHYIVMVDPAVAIDQGPADTASNPGSPNSTAYTRGVDANVFLRYNETELFYGVVWPGATVFPDWFSANVSEYWTDEFRRFFNPESGVDVDGIWIDMNEPANFQNYCDETCQQNPRASALEQAQISGNPPNRTSDPPAPNTPAFGTASNMTKRGLLDDFLRADSLVKRQNAGGASGSLGGADGTVAVALTTALNYTSPGYAISNAAGSLGNHSSDMSLVHQNGVVEYNTKNLYGTMMSEYTREAMLARRPSLKTLVITRSTFAGAGRFTGKWLGDNLSNWAQYRESISGVLGFASIYNVPMVGADVCGFGDNTTENLCARWAMLGAYAYPFFRNHNNDGSIPQEFYRWPLVTEAARKAINMRLRLTDYIYTALQTHATDGTPIVQPLFFHYPNDTNTPPIDLQLFMGPSLLVSPVTEENSTSVTFYLPDDRFYDLFTYQAVEGSGSNITLDNVDFTSIPVHIQGGSVVPIRNESAMTTTEVRTKPMQLIVAPDRQGRATGGLYVDDGVSLRQNSTTSVQFNFANNTLQIEGNFDSSDTPNLASIIFLGQNQTLSAQGSNGSNLTSNFNSTASTLTVELGDMRMAAMTLRLS